MLISLIILVLIILVGSFNFNFPNLSSGQKYISEDFGLDTVVDSVRMPSAIGLYDTDESFAPDVEDRILTKNAYLSTEVRRGKFQEAANELNSIVKSSDSFVLYENVIKHDSQFREYYSGSYDIRVETSKYDSVVGQLQSLGEVKEFNENVDDVTDSYTKLEIELEAERERLSRYESLYNQATIIEDKLALSDRIYNQERIIKYYEDMIEGVDERVDYSRVSVQLNEKHSDYAGVKFVSLGALVNNTVNGLNSLLTVSYTHLRAHET